MIRVIRGQTLLGGNRKAEKSGKRGKWVSFPVFPTFLFNSNSFDGVSPEWRLDKARGRKKGWLIGVSENRIRA